MAGLPNSSNALQQWHHLFEAQGGQRTAEATQHLQQLLRLGQAPGPPLPEAWLLLFMQRMASG